MEEVLLVQRSLQTLGHSHPINRMQKRKPTEDRFDLIALKRSKKMPLQAGRSTHRLHFGHGLLNSILTERSASTRRRLPKPVRRDRLRDGNDADLRRIAAYGARGAFDAYADPLQALAEIVPFPTLFHIAPFYMPLDTWAAVVRIPDRWLFIVRDALGFDKHYSRSAIPLVICFVAFPSRR